MVSDDYEYHNQISSVRSPRYHSIQHRIQLNCYRNALWLEEHNTHADLLYATLRDVQVLV